MAPRMHDPAAMRPVTVEYDESDWGVGGRSRLARGTEPGVGAGAGTELYGDFQVVMPLARGGMGGVFLASHAPTGRRVALKVLDARLARHPELAEQLEAEASIAARAHHPNLVEIYQTDRTAADVPYLVMEYLDGEPLAAILERGPLPIGEALAIVAQITAALAALHASGVVHCDVKPDNIVVLAARDPRGWRTAKLVDFGVSRLVDQPPLPEGAIAGTPWCMAPEQWRGAPCTASDVYAIGCLLYVLATGETPFDGSLPELMTAHLEQRPPRPSWTATEALPEGLERWILHALAKRPEDRPAMAELAAALVALADRYPAPASAEVSDGGFDDRDVARARAI